MNDKSIFQHFQSQHFQQHFNSKNPTMNQLIFQMKAVINQIIKMTVNKTLIDIQTESEKSPKSSKSNDAAKAFEFQNFSNSTENFTANESNR